MGPAIVEQLVNAGFEVTVLSRSESSKSKLPSSVTVKQINYDDPSTFVTALHGQHAVVSNVGSAVLKDQPKIIDAAIEAGVSWFIPSEFGVDTTDPKTAQLPVFAGKVATQKHLKQNEDKISYALIATGPFLDWGLQNGFLVNVKQDGTAELYDGGDVRIPATTLADIGRAVAGVLKKPDHFKNKVVHVASVFTTQNELLKIAQKQRPDWTPKTTVVKTDDLYNNGLEVLKSGNGNIGAAMVGFIKKGIFDPAYGGAKRFEKLDNDALGVPNRSHKELEEIVAQYV